NAGTSKGEGDAGGADGDPAPAPLLGDIGRGTGAAGGIEDEISGVGGHENTVLNCIYIGLNDVYPLITKGVRNCISPAQVFRAICDLVTVALPPDMFPLLVEKPGSPDSLEASFV